MSLILFVLLLTPQDQTAEAKKLIEAAIPVSKDSPLVQLEWENDGKSGSGVFQRGKAWRVDTKKGEVEISSLWDGKGFLCYRKRSNTYFRNPKDSPSMLLSDGGALAELCYSGNADRVLNGNKATLKKEKLGDVDCSHVVIRQPDTQGSTDVELHVWIDADKHFLRYSRKYKAQGKTYENAFVYKVIDPPTATADSFAIKMPADAKDLAAPK